MPFAEVSGGYLYYEQHGAGPDVVLLNGGLADVRMWASTVPWLAEVVRVTTWDCRDRGLSSVSTSPYDEIGDLAAVLDAAGVSSALLVGVSDGARQALAFAHRHPERVRRACVVAGSFGEFPSPTAEEEAARVVMREHFARQAKLLDDIPATAANDIAAWCPAVSESDRRLLVGLAIANSRIMTMTEDNARELDPPIKHRFAEVGVPVSVLVGANDFQGRQLWARRLASQAPDATLTVLPAADHMPMFSAPDEFRSYVLSLLA
ncbi:alpha/beta hydrolase [Kribbella sp. NPDC026611]|uniref:alpha/beta fold hydrolase n=1 Tax=Kribbella sp. NPDC026611 TaxID=3154911 RepID=UPI0033E122DA